MLQLRNTPDADCRISPAEIVFGQQLRDSFSFLNRLEKYTSPGVRPVWRNAWNLKEEALRVRFAMNAENMKQSCRELKPLKLGSRCLVQNQTGRFPRKWDRSGVVMEILPHDQYTIKIDGSGRLTRKNRKFIRYYLPFHPSLV